MHSFLYLDYIPQRGRGSQHTLMQKGPAIYQINSDLAKKKGAVLYSQYSPDSSMVGVWLLDEMMAK